jgi:hypothetical protein
VSISFRSRIGPVEPSAVFIFKPQRVGVRRAHRTARLRHEETTGVAKLPPFPAPTDIGAQSCPVNRTGKDDAKAAIQ